MGLRYVRGLSSRARDRLRRVREAGRFHSLEEAVARLSHAGLGDAELRALAAAGAFGSWVPLRREALWAVLGELRRQRTGGPLAPSTPSTTELPRMTPVEETLADHRTTRFTLSGHPMLHLRSRLAELGVWSIAELRERGRHGQRLTTAGLVIVRQRPQTAKGFVFVGLEDEGGRLDVIVNPKLHAAERDVINGNGLLAVRGRLGVEDGVVNLKAERFFPLELNEGAGSEPGSLVYAHDYR